MAILFVVVGGYRPVVPYNEATKAYNNVQTIHMNMADGEYNSLDIGGKAELVPDLTATMQAAIDYGKRIKGQENAIYWKRVIVLSLNPTVLYTKSDSGIQMNRNYKPDSIYVFYYVDGEDITNEKLDENIIDLGDTKYLVKLLGIDTREAGIESYKYRFRVKEL